MQGAAKLGTRPFATTESRQLLGWIGLAVCWCAALALAVAGPQLNDEFVHWAQVQRFLHGDYRVYAEYLTNVPGYHWMLTVLLWPFGVDALGWGRLVNALIALVAYAAFHRIRGQMHPADAQRATAQFFFFPPLAVYAFQVYTDASALAFLLLAFLACVKERHGWAVVALLASMAIRQNNVLWAGFFALWTLWPIWRAAGFRIWRTWRESFVKAGMYVVPVAVFGMYWAWNGSISYSNAQGTIAHPDFKPDVGNLYYLCVVAACLFPLHILLGWKRLIAYGLSRRGLWIWLLPATVWLGYRAFFEVLHPFNFIAPEYCVRNGVLTAVRDIPIMGLWFGGVATFAACGLAFARYVTPRAWLMWPFAFVFLGASWLIETRYTIVPIALFLLLRRPESNWIERLTLAWWLVLSAYLLYHAMLIEIML